MAKRVYAVKEIKKLMGRAADVAAPTAMGGAAPIGTKAHALSGPEHTGQLPTTRLSTVETDTALVAAPDGSGGVEFRAGPPLNNSAATTDPGVGDDSGDGYAIGSRWINVTSDEEFVALDVTAGAAVWASTTAGGGGGGAYADLTDVDVTGIGDGDQMIWDAGTSTWLPAAPGGVADILDLPTAETTATKVLAPDGAGGVEFRAEAGGGIADHGAFTYLDATDAAAPANPSAGYARVYSKAGRIYSRDSGGIEYGPFDAAGAGAGPLLYCDSLALGTGGDDFADASLAGWTAVNATAAAVTTEVYDSTCIDLKCPSSADRIYKSIFSGVSGSGNGEMTLTIYGYNNDGSAPVTAVGAMLGLFLVDNTGAGVGFTPWYSSDGMVLWTLASSVYSGLVGVVGGSGAWTGTNSNAALASAMPVQLKLKKVGTTITASYSRNGQTWLTLATTNSTVFTRMGIGRMYTGGGTNPLIRIGRFRVEDLA